ncbi:MAG: hypothetical protein UV73_C0017G0005 [Candidatus Gottesmanbacteria bacterium GW2011_GWA2_43_14]|uniref:ATP synthase gamma chain n=1 Tax=Candidatus Gottesmanbacteria bacterium GW2011_GWA2_43_14 TaxID=1618443 RepID=A0A0G1FK66_9BACT|nr:MAG: hypothetical protein UV73_C0017G0005 [Candidatus Gottesmanbacteria bacterium GW2011_GWA2_43_14]
MSAITDIKEQISDLTTFKHISAAFTEAAAVKLKNIREAFQRNDRFYEEINHIYHLVEMNAKKMNLDYKKGQTPQKTKRMFVALTSNQRFYGSLNLEIMKIFIRDSRGAENDRIIIGATGESYLLSTDTRLEYKRLPLKSDLPNETEMAQFLKMTENYDQVRIFYGKFVSFLKQEVGITDITRKIALEEKKKAELEDEIHLLFEPEIDKMIKFFDTQVRQTLFKRVILETELARTAARLLAMSQAEERTDTEIRQKKTILRKVSRSFTNAQLLETFSGIKRWKH